MRVSAIVAVLVFLGIASVLAQGDQGDTRPVILYAAVSTDGATIHVSGANLHAELFVALGGIDLGSAAVVSGPDVGRLTALMPALPPGSCRLRLSDAIFDSDDPDSHSLVSFDITIGVAGTSRTAETVSGGRALSQ